MKPVLVKFRCPSCNKTLAPVEVLDSATQVLTRTCPRRSCRDRWQLVVSCLRPFVGRTSERGSKVRIDKAEFLFLGRTVSGGEFKAARS